MSDAARHAAFFVAETVYGQTPATPALKRLRHTALTLGVQRGSLQSEELRSDRQISDFRLGAVTVAGDINAELSFGSFDDLLEAVLLGTWEDLATTGVSVAIAADTAFEEFVHPGAGYFSNLGFIAGMEINVSGFAAPANNGNFRITVTGEGADSRLAVENIDGSPANLITAAAGTNVTIKSLESVLKAGTVRRSFSVLRHFTDIAAAGEGKPYHLFKGVELNSLAVNVNPTAIIGATFGILGREGVAPSNDAPAGATYPAVTTTAPLDAFTGELKENGNVIGVVTEFSFNLQNGLEARNVVGSKLTIRPAIGRSTLTGSATVYFEDSSFLAKFIGEEETSLEMALPDGAGNSYVLKIPRFKFTAGQPDVAGQGSITLSMPFQALFDTVTESNIAIHRIPAP